MWYNQSSEEILNELNSSMSGLSKEKIEENKEKYGSNSITKAEDDNVFKIVINSILEPLTIILLAVILICLIIGEYKEVVIISLIITVNIIISTVQELKARKALDSLEKMTEPKSIVIRDNKSIEVNSGDLCVGDIILLEAGSFIPADIRILEQASLSVDESALTGESLHVEKTSEIIDGDDVVIGDRKNMLYSSTFITNGRAKGVVIAVGDQSEIGKIATLIQQAPKRLTPLQMRLAQLSKYVSILAFIIAALILFLSVFVNKVNLPDAFINAITLAVAVIPESLPVIVSIILALSVSKMASNNAIIKKLPAVESLGTVDVICTDKTGTLTLNKMSVTDYFIGTESLNSTPLSLDDNLFIAMTLCNDSFVDPNGNPIGDPTELALTYYVQDFAIDVLRYRSQYPRVDEVPFDSTRKLMTTIHEMNDQIFGYTKGAIDQVLERCTKIETSQGIRDISEEDKKIIMKRSFEMSNEALRVLAFAYTSCSLDEKAECEIGMTFIGAVGMIDPEKEEAKVAIAKAKHAGIKTIMITGDHPSTAYAIAKKLDMVHSEKEVITGRDLERMSDEQLNEKVNEYTVYSRVSPEHKVRIVKALQEQGKIVSMTGDGVNDAPSLQTAHIGVAMGITGTDVAKQASSMILMDDNFATIVYAVEEGRNIYNKIKRAIEFVLSTNFGEVIGILLAVLLGLATPLGAIHILWVNLIVESLIAIPISMDVNDSSVMNEKPRPKKETIFANLKLSIALISISVGLSMFLGYYLTLQNGFDLLTARTVSFAIMATAPMLYVLSLRTPKKSLLRSKPWENTPLCLAIGLGILLNTALIYTPLNSFFNLTSLVNLPLIIAFIGVITPTIIYEILKYFRNKINKKR